MCFKPLASRSVFHPAYLWTFVCLSLLTMSSSVAIAQVASEREANTDLQDPLVIHRQYKPVVGNPHVDFILPSIDGKSSIQLSDYRGKKVLLLHFASW
jgi:hypothetical protein